MGLLDRLAPRRSEPDTRPAAAPAGDPAFTTKALRKFLAMLAQRESPTLLDLGPVVGGNLTFFGEQLGCRITVEDIFTDVDRHVRDGKTENLSAFLEKRFSQASDSIDGILCWDLIDYLDKASAQVVATHLTRILRPDAALLAFFNTAQSPEARYTKYIIAEEGSLRHRPYPAARGRQTVLLNRDISRLFSGLAVSDSFLLQNNLREVLFRKPAA